MLAGGLDIGTSGCKIVIYNEKGVCIDEAYAAYDVSRKNGLHEIEPKTILRAVENVIKTVADKDIVAIAVTSFGETFVMLDEFDEPCAVSMLYTDPRGKEECDRLAERFGEKELAFITGEKPHEMYSLSKIMWIKENMPEEYQKTKNIFLMQDYIIYMLTGVKTIDYSLAARTMCFDIVNKKWDKRILEYCGIDESLLSKPVPTGCVTGKIKQTTAENLGLSHNVLIVNGAHDQVAAMIGADISKNDRMMDGTGTVECVPVLFDELPKKYELFEYGYSFVPYLNGGYACYALSYAGGASLKWFKDNFSDVPYSEMDKVISDKPTELLIMPHFAGAATPYMDSSSKAVVLGLTFEHTKADIYKALMEGTAYEIAINMEMLKTAGLNPRMMYATGGGAKSDAWLQIKADVLGIPIAALDLGEIGGAGTALIAGRAIGMYDNNTVLTKMRQIFYPIEENHSFYKLQMNKYRQIYNMAKNIMKQ